MGINVRAKGQRAERQVIDMLQPVVTEIYERMGYQGDDIPTLQRNTLQSDQGGYDITGLNWLALEVKHQEKLQVEKWWEQTVKQAKCGAEPILLYKQNNVRFRARIKAWVPVHGSNPQAHLPMVIDIDLESFLLYFRIRLISELGKG